MTRLNVMHAGLQDRIHVHMGDLLDPTFMQGNTFDLIICNPPFYTTRILPKDAHLAVAKHSAVSIAEWMRHLIGIGRLQEDGHLCLIVPAEEAHHWITAANAAGLYNHHRLDVFSFEDDATAKRSLLHFARQLCRPEINKLVMYAVDKTYTTAYLELSGIQPTTNNPR